MLDDLIGYWDPAAAVASSAQLPFDNPGGTFHHLGAPETYLRGRWDERNRLNVPGPFYCGDTDTCWTGRIYAPRHVLYDDDGQEFVYRQPVDHAQLHAVLSAAVAEVCSGYAADGDDHWTPSSVREWWCDRRFVLDWINQASRNADEPDLLAGLTDYARHIATDLETYLRCYSFWLDNRRPPQPDDRLPAIR
ncbi:hypothetical protein Cs7R123_45340 [Catellatospora sp. TT07R-123]|uniref:hypothetical protein n=1 Tax=Catellatospora sp. TT07R-123 TaxID=2733863 RepID=UPI001AFF915D|nr:hypothetical protein [Catellatospora sp. TT07R-123]GHJ47192.1 hypothetical protein Cs7R123_45340 [Catellatospora sp. TT07R-123]